MTTLTRFVIPPDSRPARPALASPHVLHATVLRAFAPEQHERFDTGRVLWRLDPSSTGHRLYIVSPEQPDLAHLRRELGGGDDASAAFDYASVLESLRPATEWRFRLRVNPTKAVRQPEGPSKRFGIVKESEQIEWLIARSPELGFRVPLNRLDLPEVIVRRSAMVDFRREKAKVTLATALFDGILVVEDVERLRHTLLHGVGRAKGYGNGLLTLAPVGPA